MVREERLVAAADERRVLRDVAVRRLAALVAQGARVSDRTVWRWLAKVEQSTAPRRAPFVLDATVRERLVFWRGNVTAVHRLSSSGGAPQAFMT